MDGTELGVHVYDISIFVRPGTMADMDAHHRCVGRG